MKTVLKGYYPTENSHNSLIQLFGDNYGTKEIEQVVSTGLTYLGEDKRTSQTVREELSKEWDKCSLLQKELEVISREESKNKEKIDQNNLLTERKKYWDKFYLRLRTYPTLKDKVEFISLELKENIQPLIKEELLKIKLEMGRTQ